MKHGTDKSSHWHGYTQIYERIFAPLRNQPITFYHPEFPASKPYKLPIVNAKPCPKSAILFLQALIHDVNYAGARTGLAHVGKMRLEVGSDFVLVNTKIEDIDKQLTYNQRYIDRIEFAGSICCIFKKS